MPRVSRQIALPVDVSEVGTNLKNPQGLAVVNDVLYVADTGNRRVAYIPLCSSVFFKPNSMKVDDLRQALNKRGISTNRMLKKELVDRLKRWISDEQRAYNVNLNKEGGTLHFSDVPNIPQLPRKSMTSPDQRILRDWRDNYGQPVVQVTVRNQSTKDNVGTLPLYAYTKPS